MYAYQSTRGANCGPGNAGRSFVVAAALLVLVGLAGVWFIETTENRSDLNRLNELRAEHGAVRNKLLTLPKQSSERPRLENRLRAVTAEHNAILSRHPTWTVRPLDTLSIDL